MKNLNSLNFAGKRALIRVDFNVPLDDQFRISDTTRIDACLPTINKVLSDGGSAVLMSHLGRPKDGPTDKYSLRHLVAYLSERLGNEVLFASDCIGEQAFGLSGALKPGQVLLLENLRFYKQEEKGEVEFAQNLSKHGDVYVNDAFGTAHRAHASTTIVAQFFSEKVCGYVMQAELENAKKVLDQVQHPYTAIMGGAKISDKILVIERLLEKVDYLLIGGAMSYTFIKAIGGEIGNSLFEADKLDLANELIEKAKSKGVTLLLPQDSVVADKFANQANIQTVDSNAIPEGFMGLDIAQKAIDEYSNIIEASKTILWNGPVGVFEMENFANGTFKIAESVVKATENGAYSLIGGGDSAAAVNSLGFGDRVSYVSTGGGALLEYMEGKVLPGVAALE